jgi:hypothetical protein
MQWYAGADSKNQKMDNGIPGLNQKTLGTERYANATAVLFYLGVRCIDKRLQSNVNTREPKFNAMLPRVVQEFPHSYCL